MIALAVTLLVPTCAALIAIFGYEVGRSVTIAHYEPIIDAQMDTIDALLPARVRILEVEPGSREDLFNRADAHCELCDGAGHIGRRPCPCTMAAR